MFVAVAVNVYAVPFVRPVQTHDQGGTVMMHVPPDTVGDAVTVYDVGTPPSVPSVAVPAATVTVTVPVNVPVPATTVGLAGVPGKVMTVTTVDPGEKFPVLASLVMTFFFTAATLNEYVP